MLTDRGDRKNYPVKEIIDKLVTEIYAQWTKSNVKFKPTVVSNRKALISRLENAWEKASAIALKKETRPNIVSTLKSFSTLLVSNQSVLG